MATTSATSAFRLYDTSIGKKAVMALSGVILWGFVVGHMIGNLQIFAGPEKINAYARTLRSMPALLWVARGILLLAVLFHAWSALQLVLQRRRARAVGYHFYQPQASDAASRSMAWGGLVIIFFVGFHLADLTFGATNPRFVHLDVYCNVMASFSIWWIAAIYILGNIFLGLHLYHGLWSVFQTTGLNSPKWTGRFRNFASFFAAIIVIGNISMPVAVLAKLLPSAGICS